MKKLGLESLIIGTIFFSACNGNSNSKGMNMDSTSSMMGNGTSNMVRNDTSNMMRNDNANLSDLGMISLHDTSNMVRNDNSNMMRNDNANLSDLGTISLDDTSNMVRNDASEMGLVGSEAKDFSKDAAQGGMMEVQLGNIAMKNGLTQTIKDFGKMMVHDHTKINDQLKDLAAKKNADLPTSVSDDQQKDIDKLSKETGIKFDKDYVPMMIKDYKDDIGAFKKAEDKISDSDYKNFIANALPTLQKHLDAIESIKKKM